VKASSYGSKVCQDLNLALKKDWKEKNNLGISASSSILGLNTSPEQGLFVLPARQGKPPWVLLAGLDETLFVGDEPHFISTRLHPHTVYPKGYEFLENFYYHPFPTWIFRIGGLTLVKMVLVIHNENTVLIRYQLLSSYGDFVKLQVKPIVAFRPAEHLVYENKTPPLKMNVEKGVVELVTEKECPPVFIFHNAAVVERCDLWIKDILYTDTFPPKEYQKEDLYMPCSFLFPFLKQEGNYLCISTDSKLRMGPLLMDITEKNRRPRTPNKRK